MQGKGLLRRVPQVFDCWFESGSMPYAQKHYPFENKVCVCVCVCVCVFRAASLGSMC